MNLSNGCALQLAHEEPIRIMALHALAYCPRLFYLEEVEEIRLADDRVYAGRTLHEVVAPDTPDGSMTQVELTGEKIGLTGKIDCLCRCDGSLIPYEHKRGRCQRINGKPTAWPSDALQVSAYGMLLEESRNIDVPEGRVRYHAENVTAFVPLDAEMRQKVLDAVTEAKRLRNLPERPPVTSNEKLCVRCSLAPICLPEEERFVIDSAHKTVRLFPADRERATIHVLTPGTQIGRSGESIHLTTCEGETRTLPTTDVDSIVLHGYSQISTQAIQLCASQNISLHWLNPSGSYLGGFVAGTGPVQRRIRQYRALDDEAFRLKLAKRLVRSKVEQTLRYILRSTRSESKEGLLRPSAPIQTSINITRDILRQLDTAPNIDVLRGYEGAAAKEYFGILTLLLGADVPKTMIPQGRNRRPPRDRFNAVLSYFYSLLYASVLQSILTVGLEPAFGFFHTPRSSTPPLVLDLMELFRLIICDMTLIGSINRLQWDPKADFDVTKEKVWLSQTGKKKAIELYERRLQDTWKHSVVGYSLSYARLIELEIRLLEKEWTGTEGLFAKFRIR
ncbi:MAG: type I-MYXAN CRISPR-associated endonuclease Cas1 [Planctomycetia bacterium]|nr:type I-MYXAN CRISPR-associated endonuclease Cas1 [Planctomycetia bacterium]